MVANGRKKIEIAVKGETTLPTVCIEKLFLQESKEVHEVRDVVTVDLPSVYLHTKNGEVIHMQLCAWLAALMQKVGPKIYRMIASTGNTGKNSSTQNTIAPPTDC